MRLNISEEDRLALKWCEQVNPEAASGALRRAVCTIIAHLEAEPPEDVMNDVLIAKPSITAWIRRADAERQAKEAALAEVERLKKEVEWLKSQIADVPPVRFDGWDH